MFGITGHRFLLFDGAVDGAKVGSAALLGNGLGRGAHCDGGGAEPSYGEEPLDELASEAGREVEPRGGDGRGALGCLDVRRRPSGNRRLLKALAFALRPDVKPAALWVGGGRSYGMSLASHRIAAGHAGRVVGFAGDDGVVAHAGVVGLMAVMFWSWSTKKGRLGRTALSAGYSFLLWGYPMEG